MNTVELTCIGCPLGCNVTVKTEGERIISVSGNTCPRGESYARKEVTDPTRIVTTTMRVKGGARSRVACKTASDIPKGKIFEVMREIASAQAEAPVRLGDVLIVNVADTGVDVTATSSVAASDPQ